MKLTKVDSSMIYAFGYDPNTKELEVIFNSGKIFRYEGVTEDIVKKLEESDSKGRYMRDNIIDVYPDYPVGRRR